MPEGTAMRIGPQLCTLLLLAGLLPLPCVSAGEEGRDGREIYQGMIDALRAAKSLSYSCEHRSESLEGKVYGVYRQEIRLEKPNHARVEAVVGGRVTGVLVLDGESLWIHWPPGRFPYNWEREGEWAERFEETRHISYMRKRAPDGRHSIGHEVTRLGPGVQMSILDPSTFHGYTDSLQRYLDGAELVGTERVGEEECDVVEVSIMRGQRTWRIWVARKDRIPRMILQTLRGTRTWLSRETWEHVVLDEDIPEESFAWRPPEGWMRWDLPKIEEGLLKEGTAAPDFDLPLSGGGRFKLSDHRGKIVWIYVWRAG
jgi:outer membrane lipoprotein-sorting protein